jgi:hypothetical protein
MQLQMDMRKKNHLKKENIATRWNMYLRMKTDAKNMNYGLS